MEANADKFAAANIAEIENKIKSALAGADIASVTFPL